MPTINIHGAGDSGGAGGGPSALNGVGQKIQDILNQLYNAGGSAGAFATAQAQLGGISPGLASMLGSAGGGGAGGRGRGRGVSGGGAATGSVGPTSVNINVKITDTGLGKLDGTLGRILDAVKAGNQAAGPSSLRTEFRPTPLPAAATRMGPVAFEAWANRGIDKQRAAAENASNRAMRSEADAANRKFDQASSQNYRAMRSEADAANRKFDQASKQSYRLMRAQADEGNRRFNEERAYRQYVYTRRTGGPGFGGASVPPTYTPPPPSGPSRMQYLMHGAADLTKLGAGFLLTGAAGVPYANTVAQAAGLGIRSGAGTQTLGAVYPGKGTTAMDWAQLGISTPEGIGLLQRYPTMPRTAAGQHMLVRALGMSQWTPGLAGLAPGNAIAVAANMFRIFGNQAPGQSAAVNALMNQNTMAGVLQAGQNAGVSVYDLQSSLYAGGENMAAASMGPMNAAGIANTITPYYNPSLGLTAAQSSQAAQSGLAGFMATSNQTMTNPRVAYVTQLAAAQANPNGGPRSNLAKMLGANYGALASSKLGGKVIGLFQDAWNRQGPNGFLTTYYFNQLTQMAAGQGYLGIQNKEIAIGEQAFGIGALGPAATTAYAAGWAKQSVPEYLASREAPLLGPGGQNPALFGGTVAGNIALGTAYIAQLKAAHPNATPAQIARMYNGGPNAANYAKVFMQGSAQSGLGPYNPGSSQSALIADALGRHYTQAQLTTFKADIPAIRAAAKFYGVSPAHIARTMGQESSGGTSAAQGMNVMGLIPSTAAQMMLQTGNPGNLTQGQLRAIATQPMAVGAGIGASEAAYGPGTTALEAFNGAITTATTAAGDLGKTLNKLNDKANALLQQLYRKL